MIDPLADFRRIEKTEGSEAALNYLNEKEQGTADANLLHHIRVARILHLHSEGRYDDAIAAAQALMPQTSCKTGVIVDIALALYRKGDVESAEAELSAAPFDSERERYEPIVLDALFFLFFLRNQRGRPASQDELAVFPSDYIQITDRGLRYGLEVLGPDFQGMEY
ncbi:hypothetical protein GOZ93_17045 [Agrobacterium vitis]|uniref:hypothetical protein n=1 Tax=Agrobacterium vitis TaxID=373 RepID=UPI0012E88368|nr:hypothetical protein [Agrobacterium vitis]MUZ83939.1 hypothetical protein [Agrobacterium vitis]NSZ20196.1 hypothetical protein [Agrobacterium vitis]QZO05119.1 hypothetical protein K4831_06220 [Agrobacterium vitis]UJL87267.1 hypothetical protein AVF2S5_04560 [Agrobacterium vitis]